MNSHQAVPDPQDEVNRIIKTAHTLGVEVDEADVAQWLAAMAAAGTMEWDVDGTAGIYGHQITLLDFDRDTLDRYRRIAEIVEVPDRPSVQTAISLAGSAAQGVIQRYPGDADYFERVNIIAPSREAACDIIAQVIRDKALDKLTGPNYELLYVRFGTWKDDVVKEGKHISAGSSVVWTADEVAEGKMKVFRSSGEQWEVPWEYGCLDPGWCKMDWVVSEPEKGRVVNASNMLDVTWEAPDGSITPLDGFIDPYFQEVYLDADSVPLFTKLSKHITPQALENYISAISHEVYKYTHQPLNYGKVAKRLYNIFRLTGRHQAAALIRELFDEPAALLYQTVALLDTIDDASEPGSAIGRETLVQQTDQLMRDVITNYEGPHEADIVMALVRLRDNLTGWEELSTDGREQLVSDSRARLRQLVNDFFQEKLYKIPGVEEFIATLEE